MTELLIKQRVFSWTDTYDVYDLNEEPKYFVEAEWLTIGHKIHIYNKRIGDEVAFIRQRLFRFFPAAEITVGGRVLGEITKEFSFFTPRYMIDYNGWDVRGDLFGWDYSVVDRNGYPVATISKEPFHWGDTYVLTVNDEKDEIEALVTVIAIDMINCSHND